MEYALDYGLLRLSPATRQRLHVPVTLLVLDPIANPCFGDPVAAFVLANIVGYDDLLLAAVKQLAESDGGKGYLRSVGEGRVRGVNLCGWCVSDELARSFSVSFCSVLSNHN